MGRVIRPAKLTFKHYAWYLQGFCLLRGAYRTFKIARMRGVEALEERFVEELNPPPIAEMSDDGNRLWVTLRLAPELEMRLLDEFYGCEIERGTGWRVSRARPSGGRRLAGALFAVLRGAAFCARSTGTAHGAGAGRPRKCSSPTGEGKIFAVFGKLAMPCRVLRL